MVPYSNGELAQMERAGRNAERCVCCGAIIPEGRQVCPTCQSKWQVDLVEVVRCKDCKYNGGDCERCLNPNLPIVGDDATYLAIDPDWYCADGKRRKDNGNT